MEFSERIERLLKKALEGKKEAPDCEAIRTEVLAHSGEERVKAIRECFGSFITTDPDSLILGCYPPFEFWYEPTPPRDAAVYERFKPLRDKLLISGGNHKTANFNYILKHGIKGHLDEIEKAEKRFLGDAQKQEFLGKLRLICNEILAWTNAHADACQNAAELEQDQEIKAQLLSAASIARKVPLYPAESFREAVQSYFFAFMLFPDGLGRIDAYLYPFYKSDIEKGAITPDEALELIENLFIKIFERQGTRNEKSGDNHGVVAGYTKDGKCGHNECTSLVLKAVSALPLWRPQISYRYTKNTPRSLLAEALEANRKRPDLVMFLNDEVIINNLGGLGIPFEDAIEYSVSGCNETVLTGCSQMGSIEGHVNLMNSICRLMSDTDALASCHSFEQLYAAFERHLSQDVELVIDYSYTRDKESSRDPSYIQSLFTTGCIENATPISLGGAKYNACTWCLSGLVNIANALSVVNTLVFEEKKITLTELSAALAANWEGYEDIRAYAINKCSFFGNDDDRTDSLANRVAGSVCKTADKHTPFRGGKYIFGTLTGYEISHVVFGSHLPASPDGRYKGDALAASICTSAETGKKGVTAFLCSASKLDGSLLPSSVVVNLTLDAREFESNEKQELLLSLLVSYFKMGGVHLQLNYLSPNTLKEAKADPQKYRSLRVRVTGFSGFFTTFDEKLQNEIINRALYSK